MSVEKSCSNCINKINKNDPCKYSEGCISQVGKNNPSHWQLKEPKQLDSGLAINPATRQAVADKVTQYCGDIQKLFAYKNSDYGADNDGFANFRKTAQRVIMPFMQRHGVEIDEQEAMFLVIMTLQDKHLVALSQTGLKGNEVAERLGDVANYSLIAKALLESN